MAPAVFAKGLDGSREDFILDTDHSGERYYLSRILFIGDDMITRCETGSHMW